MPRHVNAAVQILKPRYARNPEAARIASPLGRFVLESVLYQVPRLATWPPFSYDFQLDVEFWSHAEKPCSSSRHLRIRPPPQLMAQS